MCEVVKTSQQKYRENNLDKCREMSNVRNLHRYHTDEEYRKKTIENAKQSVKRIRMQKKNNNIKMMVDSKDIEIKYKEYF